MYSEDAGDFINPAGSWIGQYLTNETAKFLLVNELPTRQPTDRGAKHEGHQIKCLGKCSTVEEFWKEFKKVEKPSELQSTEAFYLMRDPYDPQWCVIFILF